MFTGLYPDTHIAIKNIDEYLFESFNVPKKQDIPAGHFEFKGFLCVGDKRCGKTWLSEMYLAYKAWTIWGDDIDFFKAEDIYALIDAISTSTCPVHFVILDDQVSKLDSRNPMGNRTITELYFEIAHELHRRSKLMKGNLGGLVLVAILTQSYGAIDLRLRIDSMFIILKTWDEQACKYYNLDEEVVEVLIDWKIRSNRLTDYEARKWAFVVDIDNEGCIIYFDPYLPKYKNLPFKFTLFRGIDRYREQRNQLVKFLVQNFNIIKLSDKELKEELYEKLDELENSPEKCRITSGHFTEIIYRTRKKFKKLHKTEMEGQKKAQKQELIEFLYTTFNMDDYQDSELKGELFYKLDELTKELGEDELYVSKKDFLEIIWRAKKKYLDQGPISEESKIGEINPNVPLTNVEKVYNAMLQEKIATIDRIMEITGLNRKQVSDILYKYTNFFESVENRTGVYKLKGYNHTEEEAEKIRPKNGNGTPKVLIMEPSKIEEES